MKKPRIIKSTIALLISLSVIFCTKIELDKPDTFGTYYSEGGITVESFISEPDKNGAVTLTLNITNNSGDIIDCAYVSGYMLDGNNRYAKCELLETSMFKIKLNGPILNGECSQYISEKCCYNKNVKSFGIKKVFCVKQ